MDGVRLLVWIAVAALLAQDSGHSSELTLSLFRAFNGLPGALRPLADLLYDLATLWTVAVVAAASLGARRWRLARDLLLAGLLAWLVARGLGLVLENGFRRGLSVTVRTRNSAEFPDVRLAVVVAMVATAAPYLGRPSRWFGWSVAFLLIPVELYLGMALPKSLLCALALGSAVAAGVHLVFGSPGGRPTAAQVEATLHELGVAAATDVRLAAEQPRQHTLMLAQDGDARLMIKVLGRDERDAQRIVKLWRFLLYRDSGPTLFLTRSQEVEHQAYTMLLAATQGVSVAPVVVSGTAGPGIALLAERRITGPRLADVPALHVTDEVLRMTWLQVGQLHHARIAHGMLTTANVVVTDQGPVLVGFSQASTATTSETRAMDTAELLATTTSIVGHDRAVAAAVAALGTEGVIQSLPLLQPAVLSREARQLIGGSRSEVDESLKGLRESAAQATGEPEPPLEQLRRVSGPTAALAGGLVVAVASLLSSVGDPSQLGHLLRRADPWNLLEAAGFVLSSTIGFAFALSGSTGHRLPFWSNVKVQTAGLFSNLALPLGSQALQIRFLQKQGLTAAAAVAGGGLVNLLGGLVAQIALLAIALQASPVSFDAREIPTGAVITALEATTLLILLASSLVLAVPKLRHRVLPPVALGVHAVADVVRSPRQILLLLGGSALGYLLTSFALAAILQSFGQSLPIFHVISISIGVTLLAALVPLPGGGGAVATVGMSGALVGLGIPESAAVATALANQILTQYAPALPGWLALRSLLKRGEL